MNGSTPTTICCILSVSASALRITALKASSADLQKPTYSKGASRMAVDRKCSFFFLRQAPTLSLICCEVVYSPIIPRVDFCMSRQSQKSFLKANTDSSFGILRQYFQREFFSLLSKALMSHIINILRNSRCLSRRGRYMRLNRNSLLLRCCNTITLDSKLPHLSPRNYLSSSLGSLSPFSITTASALGLLCNSDLIR